MGAFFYFWAIHIVHITYIRVTYISFATFWSDFRNWEASPSKHGVWVRVECNSGIKLSQFLRPWFDWDWTCLLSARQKNASSWVIINLISFYHLFCSRPPVMKNISFDTCILKICSRGFCFCFFFLFCFLFFFFFWHYTMLALPLCRWAFGQRNLQMVSRHII